MENRIVYLTWHEIRLKKRRKKCTRFIAVAFALACTFFLRAVLVNWGLPDGAVLEALAKTVQNREVTVEEAVAAFCREMAVNAAT